MSLTPNEIRAGLQVDPFRLVVQKVQQVWSAAWYDGDIEVARANFREFDSGVEWTKFNVLPDWQGNGLYTQALRWSQEVGGATIAGDTAEREFYLSAGFRENEGMLVQDKKASKAFLKGR